MIASFRSTMNKVARGKGKHLHYRLKIELKGTFILACGDLQPLAIADTSLPTITITQGRSFLTQNSDAFVGMTV